MVRQSPSERGSVDFFLIIAMFLIVIVGASTAGGRMGGLGKSLNNALKTIFGDEPSVCPFLQKGALSGILGLETTKITLVDRSSSIECSSPTETSMRLRYNVSREDVEIDVGSPPDFDDYPGIGVKELVNPSTQSLLTGKVDVAQISGGVYLCCDRTEGPCTCSQEDDGTETRPQPGGTGRFYCTLRYYMMTEGLGFSSEAAKDAEYAAFATSPMPSYICIIIFGLVPFLVMYYLIQDMFAFVFITPSTKKLMAVAMSAMGIVTGAFADVAYVLTKLTNISLSWSFLFLIFGTGLAAIVITNLMGLTSAASAMHRSLSEAQYGFQMLRTFGKQLEEISGKK